MERAPPPAHVSQDLRQHREQDLRHGLHRVAQNPSDWTSARGFVAAHSGYNEYDQERERAQARPQHRGSTRELEHRDHALPSRRLEKLALRTSYDCEDLRQEHTLDAAGVDTITATSHRCRAATTRRHHQQSYSMTNQVDDSAHRAIAAATTNRRCDIVGVMATKTALGFVMSQGEQPSVYNGETDAALLPSNPVSRMRPVSPRIAAKERVYRPPHDLQQDVEEKRSAYESNDDCASHRLAHYRDLRSDAPISIRKPNSRLDFSTPAHRSPMQLSHLSPPSAQTRPRQTTMPAAGKARPRARPVPSGTSKEKRRARECKIDGCPNYIINRGLCFRHGGGKQCSEEGCTSSAKHVGKCWKHGGSLKCLVETCTRKGKTRGLCWSHGGGTKCAFESCSKVAVSNSFCWAHGGGKRCAFEGCSKAAYKRTHNYCVDHYELLKDGNVTLEV